MTASSFQLNTFTKGMDLDTDKSMLSHDAYREAENVRLVTNDSGTGFVLLNVEGVKKYNLSIPSDETVIGTSTIQDIGIVITKKSDGLNKVYRVTGFDSATPVLTVILKGYLGLCEDLNTNPSLSIVSNYESNNNIKIYFTDGTSGIKVLNIVDDKYTEDSSLVDDNGNILNPLALDLTPGADLSPFQIVDLGTGSLPVGVVQYGYQLFNVHGSESVISPLSESVHLTTSITTQNSLDYKGAYKGENSGKSCEISTTYNSKDFDKCRIIRIQYEDNNDMPRIIIVDEITISSTYEEIHYIDSGNSYLGEMSIEEFNILSSYLFKGNTIEKMLNRLFVANVQEDTWDPGFYDARAYRCNLDGLVLLESSNKLNNITFTDIDTADFSTVPEDHDCINPSNYTDITDLSSDLVNGENLPDGYFYCKSKLTNGNREFGGSGVNIDYKFVTIPIILSDTLESSQHINSDCSMNVTPQQISNLIASNRDESDNYIILLEDGSNKYRQPNYADPYISSKFKSYQRDEIYRFGIIFYNEKSIPSPVYWIGDIRFPHAIYMPTFVYNNDLDKKLQGRSIGIAFNVRNVPNGTKSYEIVRCDRGLQDRTILMLGVVTSLYLYSLPDDDGMGTGDSLGNLSIDTRPYFYPEYARDSFQQFVMWNRREPESHESSTLDRSSYILNDYVRLISPEICILGLKIEEIFSGGSYAENLGRYESVIKPSTNGPRTTCPAQSVLQSDGTVASIDADDEYIHLENNNTVAEFETTYSSPNDPNNNIYYPASIFKYYSFNRLNTYRDTHNASKSTIQQVKYSGILPYNAYETPNPYKISIAERTYNNFSITRSLDDKLTYIGICGPSLIVYSPNFRDNIDPSAAVMVTDLDGSVENLANAITLVNVKVINTAQYGGNTYASRSNSVYVSTNSYNRLIGTSSDEYVVTFGGDTYLGLLDYPFSMTFLGNDENTRINLKKFVGAYIPFETSINLNLLNGDMAHMTYNAATNYIDSHLQMEPTLRLTWHVQDTPYFVYNAVYSSLPGSRKFLPKSIYSESNMKMSNRILVSLAKTNNEILDNWTVFKAADFLDVDSLYGNITNLKKFKDRLFFFLDQAVGIAAVNERSLINDGNVGQLVLGTGGILTRYDYITTTNGTSIINDRSICESDNVLYWYDYDKNELCHYTGQVGQLSKEKLIQSYLNEMYDKKRNVVLSFYDKKYNEMWFKFYDRTIAFNEMIGRFTSFYTFNPDWSLVFSDKIVTLKDNDYYVINTLDTDGLGEVSKDANIKFIVNDNYFYTKVFDNILISGDLLDGNRATKANGIITKLLFDTKHQHSEISNPTFDYREDTFRLPIPREETDENDLTYSARMRGKLLECEYDFDANDGKTFRIPQIITTYRYSRV